MNVTVTGSSVHVPSIPWAPGSPQGHPVHEPAEARMLLGRKGLLAKEPATRLALMATYEALGGGALAGATAAAERAPGLRTAVVVASMLNSCATVCATVEHTATHGPAGISAMTAPNASSNVVASSLAIRFGFTGPNLLVTNGATSGIDAVRLGARLLLAGRAARVVVVGVEPNDTVTRRLSPGIVEGAGCVVLERDVPGHPVLGGFGYDRSLPATYGRHPVPGHFHAASGVIQLAAACAEALPDEGLCVWSGSQADGYASVLVSPSPAPSSAPPSAPSSALAPTRYDRALPATVPGARS